ncbi:hypothetical protein ACCUM_3499 [Candidatus Accumulibacter phosphatis]|uniref:Uncharacterized protein n=1 Tax=Candidatus Accumulibacter phosphatis TaxID=327160 RepID=A0A5S4EP24_9PROT|nr:hypothetical protein ACCUM_3499 [Candidatus Accumulibacter phosphatis]
MISIKGLRRDYKALQRFSKNCRTELGREWVSVAGYNFSVTHDQSPSK